LKKNNLKENAKLGIFPDKIILDKSIEKDEYVNIKQIKKNKKGKK